MKRGTPEHPKTTNLMRLLSIPRYQAVGILESLWHFAARYSPCGDIGKWSDEEISTAIGWEGNAQSLMVALIDSRFVDECPDCRLSIHDWKEHADDATRKYISRNGLAFVGTSLDKSRQVAPAIANTKPEPLPVSTRAEEPAVLDGGFLDRPPGAPSEVAAAKAHMRRIMGEARLADPDVPLLPKFDQWVEGLMGQCRCGQEGLAYIQTYAQEDFQKAFTGFTQRKNKSQTWTGTWVENARNARHAKAQEDRAAALKRKETQEAAGSNIAAELGLDLSIPKAEWEERERWWGNLSSADRNNLCRKYAKDGKNAPPELAKIAEWKVLHPG